MDIGPIVAGWDHDDDEMQVRIIRGLDGLDKLQIRVDLGLLQLELDGRPDGTRPHGAESLLEHHEARAAEAVATKGDYGLDGPDCEELLAEGFQYYRRYLACFHLGRYDLVVRDTDRNLRLFAFVKEHAVRRRDVLAFDQYRPYVTMMRARGRAHQCLDRDDHRGALERIDEGIGLIKDFLREYDQEENAGQCRELVSLREWRRQVERERRVDPVERIEDQLRNAVAREDYEEAARLRDQIQRLRGIGTGP